MLLVRVRILSELLHMQCFSLNFPRDMRLVTISHFAFFQDLLIRIKNKLAYDKSFEIKMN